MAESPDTNPSHPLTELSFLNQPSQEQERDSSVPTGSPDAPVAAAEPNQNLPCSFRYVLLVLGFLYDPNF
jgi:hypothetical protein